MIVARELASRGKEVVAVIEKEKKCGGLPHNRNNCLERYGIPLITESTVSEVHGVKRVAGVTIVSFGEGKPGFTKFISCDTLITSVGLIPERDLLDSFTTGALPERVFLCGNACYVHDIVDDVTVESERTGRYAAEFALRGSMIGAAGGEPGDRRGDSDRRDGEAIRNAWQEPWISGGAPGDSGVALCVACPKNCAVVRTEGGWQGLACGRSEPQL